MPKCSVAFKCAGMPRFLVSYPLSRLNIQATNRFLHFLTYSKIRPTQLTHFKLIQLWQKPTQTVYCFVVHSQFQITRKIACCDGDEYHLSNVDEHCDAQRHDDSSAIRGIHYAERTRHLRCRRSCRRGTNCLQCSCSLILS